jgi:glycosyltransferase involved in cell wall biosynthesis
LKQKIQVLHIIKSLGRGGAEMLLPETLKCHDKNTFAFHYVFFLPWKNQMVDDIERNGGKVTCFASRNNIEIMMNVFKIVEYIRKNDIKLIHAHLPWAGILARIVGKVSGVPVIYSEHNKLERYHWITRFVNICTMGLLSTLIAVSNDVAQSVYRYKPKLKIPFRVIPNGVNIDYFRRASDGMNIRNKLGIPVGAPIVGTIAVFRTQKRLDVWIDIAKAVLDKISNAHFVVVGDGPLRDRLIEKRDRLGLQTKIHFPGLETEVRPYLEGFDVFMMSSLHEGLPVALLEAMSMECAIVSTNAGGIKEVVRDGVDGLLTAVDNTEQLTNQVCSMLSNPEMRLTFGRRARERIVSSFSIRSMVDDLERLYKETIK